MFLGDLLKSTEKKYQKIPVKGISFDSRKVKRGDVFFAIRGKKTSGLKFIKKALFNGASIIVSEKNLMNRNNKVPFIKVKDVRKSLSEASSKLYTKKPKNIIAVTGTNGKSSVADFFYQLLSLNKIPVASIGTLGIVSKNYNKKTKLTSIDAISLHKSLQILSIKKINHVILEASSHGLDQKRLDNININCGVFTNLSHDHLDYHKSMRSYFKVKMYLFENLLRKNSAVVTDEDIKEFKIIKKISYKKKLKKFTIGKTSGTIKILHHRYKDNKQIIKVLINSKSYLLEIPLVGYFQIKNLFMAVLVAIFFGLSRKKILHQIKKIKPVLGRLECVTTLKNNSNIIVDFAHTPDALEQSLVALKKQFKKEIILVFGCGGERDKKKRFSMGAVAKKYCRKIFVTDDNPRNENPKKIRNAVIKGCKKLAVDIADRKNAITAAIKELRSNEILLVAGKGHESDQDYGNKVISFSDKKIIKEIINKKQFYFNNDFKNLKYNGVSINSKTLKKNNLFFAIKGKKNDGHNFVKEAIKKGAIKSFVNKKILQTPKSKIIKVKNTFSSLNELAKINRENSSARIIGVTGSVGKTTLKNLISFVLNNYGKVYHSPLSYNNKFGVPLSLANLKGNINYGVFEIGMDKKGEIDKLSKIVKPEIGIITNISEAHIKNFNTLKDIAKAKGEIINNILDGGSIILNKDSKFFNFLFSKAKRKKIKVVSFSQKKGADIFLLNIKKIGNYYKLKVEVKKKIYFFYTTQSTNNFINNVLACISTLFVLNIDLNNVEKDFIDFKIPSGRGDIKIIKKFKKTFKLIDESYNANPLSMKSAIQNMSYYKVKNNAQKLVFLSDMLELGKKSKKLHKKLSNEINKSDIDKVFVYGKDIKETFDYLNTNKKGKIFNNLQEAYSHFSKIIHNNDLLMVKGSNATGLSQFSKNIKKGKINAL